MSRPVRVSAPAKINLVLRVLERREDGFHDLETVFQSIDLADEVEVALAVDGRITLEVVGPEPCDPEENLAYRAAEAFVSEAGSASGVAIRLSKRIPSGAGLGGGSSDAAAVLRALSHLTEGAVAPERLQEVATTLGSDIAFFLCDSPLALGRGRGEILEPMSPLPVAHLVVALPPVRVATGPAYGALAASRDGGVEEERRWSGSLDSWSALAASAHNDFQPVVASAHREVAQSLAALTDAGASVAMLSGSGAASFGFFSDADAAGEAAKLLTVELGWPCLATHTRTGAPAIVAL